jgi:hypothetical protein
MRPLIVGLSAVALLGFLAAACTGRSEPPPGAQADSATAHEGTPPTAPPAALDGKPLGPSTVIYPWEWGWRTERR